MPICETHIKLVTELKTEPYAWPGGYPKYAVVADGGCLCHKCMTTEHERLSTVEAECPDDDQWRVIGLDINWEDTELTCDHCNAKIECAYSEEEN